ncbi:recombinase family protein [Spirosoma sp. BT702]|uniref:Recombinase family protein n=1 Tax=Spirosoma profusum TaxID=2771354 RepID=A0A927AW30_9BACT|nr:recombinase family protein [Spirosoma profusum]MBD2705436.1 recombinase family protein [Spirosoma profusum]
MKQAIAYYRVSTHRQGRSGLGLEAQQTVVANYCRQNEYNLIDEIIEVKSTRKQQYRLLQALDTCKHRKATLMVARLDRLGRDVEKIARLVKSDVEIVVTDNPHANRFTIHILAAVAEEQRQRISETTKAALDAARKRGVILGKHGKTLARQNKKVADEFAQQLSPMIKGLKKRGIITMRAIAQEFNRQGVPTFRGDSQWHPSTVCAVQKRLKQKQPITMKIQPDMVPSNENNLLFDDRSLLEVAFGDKALTIASINTNCDCDGYYPNPNDEERDTHQIPASTAAIC